MSAYVVHEDHLRLLVQAAVDAKDRYSDHFTYYHGATRHEVRSYDETATETVGMLLAENVRSVEHRYPDGNGRPFERDTPAYRRVVPELSQAQVFKAIDGYAYQACETDGWETSQARAFCDELRKTWCRRTPGYDAAHWEFTSDAYREQLEETRRRISAQVRAGLGGV